MLNYRMILQKLLGAYFQPPFRRVHLFAIIFGVLFGGVIGSVLLSGDQGRQPWFVVAFGYVIGAIVGTGLALAAVRDMPKK